MCMRVCCYILVYFPGSVTIPMKLVPLKYTQSHSLRITAHYGLALSFDYGFEGYTLISSYSNSFGA